MDTNDLKNDLKDGWKKVEHALGLGNPEEPATGHDTKEGGAIGAVGGGVVGALAGGPVGAVIGAVAGGAGSAAAVNAVDKHDNDYARTATTGTTTYATGTVPYADDAMTDEDDSVLDGPAQTMQLRKEELNATTQAVQTGEVTLRKEVISETKSIDVPVTREEVVIERHAVSGVAATSADFGTQTDEVIRVPVMEEQVTVYKTPVVTEEITLGKRQVTETEHITDTVRHEEARIENPDNVDVLHRN